MLYLCIVKIIEIKNISGKKPMNKHEIIVDVVTGKTTIERTNQKPSLIAYLPKNLRYKK